jgi:peptidoglycan pentaglycine glycine transferase (the first glycine)
MSAPAQPTDRWKAWDDFLETTPDTGFMQSSSWADLRLALGYEHFGAILKHRDRILGGAIVQKYSWSDESCLYYVQDGPVIPNDPAIAVEVFEAIMEEIENHGKAEQQTVSHLRIEPRWQKLPNFVSGFEPHSAEDDFMEPRKTLCVDLRPSESEILAQMKRKGRHRIGLAKKFGVSVVEDTSEQGIADFVSIYSATATRHGIEEKPPEYFEGLVAVFSPHHKVSIFFAEHDGKRIATQLVIYFGPRATSFFGGSLDTHRHLMAPYLMQFEIMCRAKARGYQWYDMWGIAAKDAENDSWYNFSIFKRNFGGVEVDLVPTLDYVYDRSAYDAYVAEETSSE